MNSNKSTTLSSFNETGKLIPGADSCSSGETQTPNVSTIAVHLLLASSLFLVSILGNGFMCFLLARFKQLQTVSNFLLVDLAVVNLLSVGINGPLFVCYVVLDLDALRGRLVAWFVSTLHVFFAFLTLITMFLMLIHRFLAIRFPLKYRAMKTKQNVLITIAVKWLLNFIIVLSVYVPLLKIDLGTCGSVIEYRESYANESHQVILRVFTPLVLLGIIVLFLLSWRAFGQKSRENGQIHPTLLANLQTITKRRNQVALKTILITVVIFCISYVPVVLRSVHSLGMQGGAKKWLLFVLSLLLFLPNAIDPFIYFARVANFRSAIKQLYQRSASNIQVRKREEIPLNIIKVRTTEEMGAPCTDDSKQHVGVRATQNQTAENSNLNEEQLIEESQHAPEQIRTIGSVQRDTRKKLDKDEEFDWQFKIKNRP